MSQTSPLLAIAERLRDALRDAAREAHGIELDDLALGDPPKPGMGDLACAAFLPLARELKKPPRAIAEAVLEKLAPVDGVDRVEIAGPGYLNVFLDRRALTLSLLRELEAAPAPPTDIHEAPRVDPDRPKVVVEHTNINPNKAAHVGHLRNAVLGDCLVRLLQHSGAPVEVQNYIDDTGVQVADVVVAFSAMEERSPEEGVEHVKQLIASEERPFDHVCWDAYSAVGRWYAEDETRQERRSEALHAMEEDSGPLAEMGRLVAGNVVRCHLALMNRIGVRYHLLPWESDILTARFWQEAFDRMREGDAIRRPSDGKHAGCWVMPLTESEEFKNLEEPDKVLVRANGTVTYTGKDIAFQMWKFGLVSRDFRYRLHSEYEESKPLWTTDMRGGVEDDHPEFGHASAVYNVIDARQSYPQAVVRNALALTGREAEAAASVHYAYEMVALTPRTAEALGFELSEEERAAAYVEMSGRKGLGVKASDLLDLLVQGAREKVSTANEERELGLSDEEVDSTARDVAVGALRYYMAKFTRNSVIAFDTEEALQFQGEAGPYLQYSLVRTANIFRRLEEAGDSAASVAAADLEGGAFELLENDASWDVVLAALRLPEVVARSCKSLEIAHVAKHAFSLCQAWNRFYIDNSILHADTDTLRKERAAVARILVGTLRQVLGLLGIPEPERM